MTKARYFIFEKTEAQEGGRKLPKVTEQDSGGQTAHPQFPHLSGEDHGAAGRRKWGQFVTHFFQYLVCRWPDLGER